MDGNPETKSPNHLSFKVPDLHRVFGQGDPRGLGWTELGREVSGAGWVGGWWGWRSGRWGGRLAVLVVRGLCSLFLDLHLPPGSLSSSTLAAGALVPPPAGVRGRACFWPRTLLASSGS